MYTLTLYIQAQAVSAPVQYNSLAGSAPASAQTSSRS